MLADGFAVMEGAPGDRHAIAVDWDGRRVDRRAVPVIAPSVRMVGAAGGIAVGWQDGNKLALARVSGDGELDQRTSWGKRVTQLCDGTASNEHRFGIGWLESDGRVWVVHGPTSASAVTDPVATDAELTRTVWCGVTSAGEKIALLWRDQHNRTQLDLCDRKGCSNFTARLPIAKQHALAGIACVETACLFAIRDDRGGAQLGWMTTRGKLAWSRPLADATANTGFSIVAAGDRAFVIGYVTREGAMAARVIEGGSLVRAWADPSSTELPALAWANDRLLVAHRHGDRVAPEIVALPR